MGTKINIKKPRTWIARISQTGTNAPDLTVLVNDFGITVTPQYFDVGQYILTGFNGILTGNYIIQKEVNFLSYTNHMVLTRESSSSIGIGTFTLDVLSNDVLVATDKVFSYIIVHVY